MSPCSCSSEAEDVGSFLIVPWLLRCQGIFCELYKTCARGDLRRTTWPGETFSVNKSADSVTVGVNDKQLISASTALILPGEVDGHIICPMAVENTAFSHHFSGEAQTAHIEPVRLSCARLCTQTIESLQWKTYYEPVERHIYSTPVGSDTAEEPTTTTSESLKERGIRHRSRAECLG